MKVLLPRPSRTPRLIWRNRFPLREIKVTREPRSSQHLRALRTAVRVDNPSS